jgi:hypothetical protein
MRAFLVVVPFIIAACASPEQQAQRRAAEMQQQKQAEIAYQQGLFNQCRAIGYQPDTEPFRQCVLQLHTQNQQNAVALDAALLQGAASQPRVLPSCRGLPPGTAGYARAQGKCY